MVAHRSVDRKLNIASKPGGKCDRQASIFQIANGARNVKSVHESTHKPYQSIRRVKNITKASTINIRAYFAVRMLF